jgi:phosphatidylglycerophosphate synthase
MTPTPAVHSRENLSILAGIEKPLLVWIAERLPAAISSDHLSALGLVAMGAAGFAFACFPLTGWAALGVVVCLVLNWFGDSLDGTVARVRNQQRPRYGFYVDHVIDLAGSTLLVAGMGLSGLMSPILAGGVLAAYLLVSAESYLATHAAGFFRMSFAGIGPTELRIVLAAGALKVRASPFISVGGADPVRLFDLGAAVAIPCLACAFIVSSYRNATSLRAAEPVPARPRGERAA